MEERPIYHITHVANLASIVSERKLWSDAQRLARRLPTTNIGHLHIKERRLRRAVTCAAGGTLGEYVPFNFCPRSVMLYVIHRGSVMGYEGGQEPIVHLVSSVRTAIASGRPWAFTNRHAELHYAEYFDRIDREDQVDWSLEPVMHLKSSFARGAAWRQPSAMLREFSSAARSRGRGGESGRASQRFVPPPSDAAAIQSRVWPRCV